jgi:hypothetical protein
LEPPLCVVSSWVIKRIYTILISNTINESSNLDICFYHCLIITLISHLKDLFNSLLIYIYIYIYRERERELTSMLFDPGPVGLFITLTPRSWDKTSTIWSCHPPWYPHLLSRLYHLGKRLHGIWRRRGNKSGV